MGPNWSPVLFWQGQKVKENTSVKSKSRWTPGMNYILLACSDGVLLQVFQWDFLKAWAHFLTVHWAKERRACRNVLLEISIKGDFSKLLGQTFDWLSAVNRAKTRLKVLIRLSTEKKKADRSSARWHVHSESRGSFQTLCYTLTAERDIQSQWGVRCWELSELAAVQCSVKLQRKLGPHFLAKGSKSMWDYFGSFQNQVNGLFQWSCAEDPNPAGAQLYGHRFLACSIQYVLSPATEPNHWSEGSVEISSSRLFHLSLFLFFFSFVKTMWNAKFGHKSKEYLSCALKLGIQLKCGLRFKGMQTHVTWNSNKRLLEPLRDETKTFHIASL